MNSYRKRELESWHKDKAVQDEVTESWLCVDCGRNTAPGVPDGPSTRKQIKRRGKFKFRVGTDAEVFMVRNAMWREAGMRAWNGCVCIGCIEKRLGRRLTPKDFNWGHVFNGYPATRRLHSRRKFTLVRRDGCLFYMNGQPAVLDRDHFIPIEIPWSRGAEFEFEGPQ